MKLDQGVAMRLAPWLGVVTAATLIAVIFCWIYIRHEQPVYAWDYAGYWSIYKNYGHLFWSDRPGWLASFRREVGSADYNPSSTLALMPVYGLLGGSRTVYVSAVAVIYLIPAALCAAVLAGPSHRSRSWRIGAFTLAFLYPPFWAPTLRGLIDVCGLVPLGLAALIVVRTGYLTRSRLWQAVVFGTLLWCAFLFRRWYAFSIVSLLLVSLVFAGFELRARSAALYAWLRAVLAHGLAILVAGALAVSCQWQLITTIVSTSYADSYSAYQRSLEDQAVVTAGRFGAFLLILAAMGLVAAIRTDRWHVIFCAVVASVAFLLFSRVQSPAVQHSLPIALFLFPSVAMGANAVIGSLHSRLGRGVVGLVAVLNALSSFASPAWGPAEPLRAAFATKRFPPLAIENYDQYRAMIADLRALPKDSRFAVFASSLALSDSLIGTLAPDLNERIEWVSQVDLRDRFKLASLRADYVVIGTPTPQHLPDGQRVIGIPAEEIRGHTGIGAAYLPFGGPYRLSGTMGEIYRRERPLTGDELEAFLGRFYIFYPDWKRHYDSDIGLALARSDLSLGDASGSVEALSEAELGLYPGETRPSVVIFPDSFQPSSMAISVAKPDAAVCLQADGIVAEIQNGGGPPVAMTIEPGESKYAARTGVGRLRLSVTPRTKSSCRQTFVSFSF